MGDVDTGATYISLPWWPKCRVMTGGMVMEHPEYVFYELPSAVWAIEFTNHQGDRVVEVLGTEYAAREAADHYKFAGVTLLRSTTDSQPIKPQ